MEQLHAAVEQCLQPLAQNALVSAARFLDPQQFRDAYKGDVRGACDDVGHTTRLVNDVFDRQRRRIASANAQASGEDPLRELSIAATGWNGWPAKDLLGAIRRCSSADKSDAVDPLDWVARAR
jgi:hypothetical protein